MTKTFDIDQLIFDTRRLADENPAAVNAASLHFGIDGEPVCIMGHALAAQGFTKAEINTNDISAVLHNFGFESMDEPKPNWVLQAQIEGDRESYLDYEPLRKQTWSEAIVATDAKAGEALVA